MPQKVIREPKQVRSKATKDKLKKAAMALFTELGYYQVTSRKIAKAAKVPIGSFYNYFGDKKGILLVLMEEFCEEYHQTLFFEEIEQCIQHSTSITSASQRIGELLNNLIQSPFMSDPFYRLIHILQYSEKDVLELVERYRIVEGEYFMRLIERINQFHPIQDKEVAAKLIFTTGENVSLYINYLGTPFDRERLIKETALMINRYLFGGYSAKTQLAGEISP